MDDRPVVQVAPGIALPESLILTATPSERKVLVAGQEIAKGASASDLDTQASVTMVIVLNRSTLIYEVQSVEVKRIDGGPEVTGAMLRGLRVNQLMLRAVAHAIDTHADDRPFIALLTLGEIKLDTYERAYGDDPPPTLTREELGARVYAVARAMGRPPLKSVAETLGVSRSTAIRLIAQARKIGLLS